MGGTLAGAFFIVDLRGMSATMPFMKYKSGQEFLNAENKAITLMGMSGVGKSYLSIMMEEWGWFHYSCDVEIGTTFLSDKMPRPVTPEDVSPLSDFIGKLGDVSLAQFKAHQKMYYDAEIEALKAAAKEAQKHRKFVNDSTGSICEILDDDVLAEVGRASLFVYIKAGNKEEKEILQRAQDYPKPLFYPPKLLDSWVDEYMQLFAHNDESQIEADEFVRFVFPRLFETRLPKYDYLAEQYGVMLHCEDVYKVKSEDDLLQLIAGAF